MIERIALIPHRAKHMVDFENCGCARHREKHCGTNRGSTGTGTSLTAAIIRELGHMRIIGTKFRFSILTYSNRSSLRHTPGGKIMLGHNSQLTRFADLIASKSREQNPLKTQRKSASDIPNTPTAVRPDQHKSFSKNRELSAVTDNT
jgi:hypothetical protein